MLVQRKATRVPLRSESFLAHQAVGCLSPDPSLRPGGDWPLASADQPLRSDLRAQRLGWRKYWNACARRVLLAVGVADGRAVKLGIERSQMRLQEAFCRASKTRSPELSYSTLSTTVLRELSILQDFEDYLQGCKGRLIVTDETIRMKLFSTLDDLIMASMRALRQEHALAARRWHKSFLLQLRLFATIALPAESMHAQWLEMHRAVESCCLLRQSEKAVFIERLVALRPSHLPASKPP